MRAVYFALTTSLLCCSAWALTVSDNVGSGKGGFLAPLKLFHAQAFGKSFLMPSIEISIGTPPQQVELFFDTGSYIPVVYNKSCTVPGCGPAGIAKYDTAASSTAKVQYNHPTNQQYGAGNASGYYMLDNFSFPTDTAGIASNWVENFTIVNDAHWKPSQAGLVAGPADGIFGMGPDGTGPAILWQKYGIDLVTVRSARGINRQLHGGVAQFGGYDKLNPERKEPVWSTPIPAPWFLTYIEDILLDGVSTGACQAEPVNGLRCGSIVDTGGAVLEFQDAGMTHSATTSNISCDQIDTLPSIGVVINGSTFTLEPQDYIIRLPDGSCESVIVTHIPNAATPSSNFVEMVTKRRYVSHRVSTKQQFLKVLQQSPTNSAIMDFGVVWTSRVTTIFDWKHIRLGFIEHQ